MSEEWDVSFNASLFTGHLLLILINHIVCSWPFLLFGFWCFAFIFSWKGVSLLKPQVFLLANRLSVYGGCSWQD